MSPTMVRVWMIVMDIFKNLLLILNNVIENIKHVITIYFINININICLYTKGDLYFSEESLSIFWGDNIVFRLYQWRIENIYLFNIIIIFVADDKSLPFIKKRLCTICSSHLYGIIQSAQKINF